MLLFARWQSKKKSNEKTYCGLGNWYAIPQSCQASDRSFPAGTWAHPFLSFSSTFYVILSKDFQALDDSFLIGTASLISWLTLLGMLFFSLDSASEPAVPAPVASLTHEKLVLPMYSSLDFTDSPTVFTCLVFGVLNSDGTASISLFKSFFWYLVFTVDFISLPQRKVVSLY